MIAEYLPLDLSSCMVLTLIEIVIFFFFFSVHAFTENAGVNKPPKMPNIVAISTIFLNMKIFRVHRNCLSKQEIRFNYNTTFHTSLVYEVENLGHLYIFILTRLNKFQGMIRIQQG